jgi:hypothetical protein
LKAIGVDQNRKDYEGFTVCLNEFPPRMSEVDVMNINQRIVLFFRRLFGRVSEWDRGYSIARQELVAGRNPQALYDSAERCGMGEPFDHGFQQACREAGASDRA